MLAVTTPATDPRLLSAEEMRLAVGLASNDTSRDAALLALNNRISAIIARSCRVAAGGAAVATLRRETLTETFRPDQRLSGFMLSRRPVSSITSVVEDGTTLTGTDYEVDLGSGLLRRLRDDREIEWSCRKTLVVYVAGWDVVPEDLKMAAANLAKEFYSVSTRDPNLKRIKVDGVDEREYFYGQRDDPLMSKEVQELLAPYVNYWLG